jgi:D-3-phosphoglycerate dehydrogenase
MSRAPLDVFQTEPAKESPLFGTKNFICTPHLGASTTEAQVNVALQVAEQLGEYLTTGGVTNALNVPSLSAEEAPSCAPTWRSLKSWAALLVSSPSAVARISIHTEGAATELNAKPIVAAVLCGFLRVQSATVNMVNAPFLAKERGLEVREVKTEKTGDYHTLIRVSVKTEAGERSVAGTLFSNAEPRLVELFGIKVEAELAGDMMYIVNEDAPASSAASVRCWVKTASTSARSTLAAAKPVVKLCCCSRSTARLLAKCSTLLASCPA